MPMAPVKRGARFPMLRRYSWYPSELTRNVASSLRISGLSPKEILIENHRPVQVGHEHQRGRQHQAWLPGGFVGRIVGVHSRTSVSFRAAATMCRAKMPAASKGSAGCPDMGRPLTPSSVT